MMRGAAKASLTAGVALALTLALIGTAWALGGRTALAQPPTHVFIGTATLNGAPAANATINAVVGSDVCGTATADAAGGFVLIVNEAGAIGSDPMTPAGCVVGAAVGFTVNGVTANEISLLALGGDTRNFNLTAVTGAPSPTPSPTVVPPVPTPTRPPQVTPTPTTQVTPQPTITVLPSGGGLPPSDGGGAGALWLSLFALGLVSASGGLALARRLLLGR